MTDSLHATSFGWVCLMGLLLLPIASLPSSGFVFPLDSPLWSLFYEMAANTGYGGAARYLRTIFLPFIVILGAVATIVTASIHGSFNLGSTPGIFEAIGGSGRVCFSFFGGVLLFRFLDRLGKFFIPTSICTIALVLIFAAPVASRNWVVDAICVGFVFPAILLAGTKVKVTGVSERIYSFLGEISYPLYAIHYPIIRVFQYIQLKYQLTSMRLAVSIVVEVLVAIAAAYVVLKIYDEPTRRYLRSLLERPKARMADQAQREAA